VIEPPASRAAPPPGALFVAGGLAFALLALLPGVTAGCEAASGRHAEPREGGKRSAPPHLARLGKPA